jgi:HAD superfamily hydrolase (TIGR01484 family)
VRYLALATDYDGTLASDGEVFAKTVEALDRFRASGRRLIMVTGRELDELLEVCNCIDRFDIIVAENGAVLYTPVTRDVERLCDPPNEALVTILREKKVQPFSVGQVIIATREPHEVEVLDAIRDLGLELQVIFNKGAVMVLPSGVNKASGLTAALRRLHLSHHNVVAVGDAENDHTLLKAVECGVAVANALTSLKDHAHLVTDGARGAGVEELIDRMLATDLNELDAHPPGHGIEIGKKESGEPLYLSAYGTSAVVAGPSGSGKSTLVTAILESLGEKSYQFAVVDPEGDYENFPGVITVGTRDHGPDVSEVLSLLEKPDESVVINLLGVALRHRPAFFQDLLPHLLELRARTGRPHWIVLDEAHHMLPAAWKSTIIPHALHGLLMITMQPDLIAGPALEQVEALIAVGGSPERTITAFTLGLDQTKPRIGPLTPTEGHAFLWSRDHGPNAIRFRTAQPKSEHRRHRRKYVVGSLSEDESFYFRGPKGRLNLRAENLGIFIQMAKGVDGDTWLHHLKKGHYSDWFKCCIKDDDLSAEARKIEMEKGINAADSRARILAAIASRYTVDV